MQQITLKAAATQVTDQGVFEAVISTENIDREKDIVSADAMVEALKKWNRPIPLAWNHSTKAEDIFGSIEPMTIRAVNGEVIAQGRVDLDSKIGKEAWRSFKNRTIGFSFGYITLKHDNRKGGGRNITGLDIFEVTATPTPMNNDTRVLGTKGLVNDALDRLADEVIAGNLDTDAAAKQLREALGDRGREDYERMAADLLAAGVTDSAVTDSWDRDQLPEPEVRQSIPVRMSETEEARLSLDALGLEKMSPPADGRAEDGLLPRAINIRSTEEEIKRLSESEEARVALDAAGLKLMLAQPDGPLDADGLLPRPEPQAKAEADRLSPNEEARVALDAAGLKLMLAQPDGPLDADGLLPQPEPQAKAQPDRLPLNEEARLALLAAGLKLVPIEGGRAEDGVLPRARAPEARKADRLETNQEARLALLSLGWELSPIGDSRAEDGLLPQPEPQSKAQPDRLSINDEARVDLMATGVAPGDKSLLDEDEIKGLLDGSLKAVWSAAFINDLPDSSFLYIESGGSKDESGKTKPRSLRHFPYKDSSGKVDLPHLRNALARIPQSNIPQDVKDRLTKKAQSLLDNAKAIDVPNDDSALGKAEADDPALDKSATAESPHRTHDDDRAIYSIVTDGIDMKAPPEPEPEPPPEVPHVSELNREFYDLMLETLLRKE